MKKVTLLIGFVLFFFSTLQIQSQIINDAANWPNTNWSITGSYNTVSGFASDPRTTANFSWDDDLAGSGSLADDIAAESPIIDLTPAIPTEQQLQLTVDYVYRRVGDVLTLEYWDQDLGNWRVWEQFQNNSSNLDFKSCTGMQTFISTPLVIATFSTTQLLNFKYRIRFNDNGFDWGMCFASPTLTSLATANCLAVSSIIIDSANITENQASIDWVDNNGVPPANGWEIEYGPTGFTQGTGTVVSVAIRPYLLSSLMPDTSYDVYVRALCSTTDQSAWVGPVGFMTLPSIVGQGCGGQFVDSGGPNGQYSNGEDITTTLCPDNIGDVVTVNFLSFSTESCCDNLTIYDGPDNTATNLGTFAGTNLPPTFTSTHSSGCLTFVFHSDGSIVRDGWVANIICSPPPTCFAVTNIQINNITLDGAEISWTDNNTPPPLNGWEVEIVPSGTTPTGVGTVTTTNPFVATGLNPTTLYDVYVRAICDDAGNNDPSFWIAATFATLVAPPECGGVYVDSGGLTGQYENNEDITTTICPNVAGEVVTIQFLEFDVEAGFDSLSIFNGDSAAAPLLGVFDGANLPPPFTSTDTSGCLTFVFHSDFVVARDGWLANVLCSPPPTCWWVENFSVTNQTDTTVDLSWTDNLNTPPPLGGWNIEYGTTGFTQGTGTIVNAPLPNTNFIVTGLQPSTNYDFYIQAQCAVDDSDSSFWIGPIQGTTTDVPPPNDTCITAIPLTVNVDCQPILGNNILATSSTDNEGEVLPDCADPAANGVGIYDALDVWYTFEVPVTGAVVIETSNAGGMVDSVLAAYTGTCGALVELDCQDDSVINPQSDDFRYSSINLTELTPGETIYVRVWSFPTYISNSNTIPEVQGAFNICVYGLAHGHTAPLNVDEDNELVDDIQLSYYPNPVNNILTVSSDKEISEITLYSVLGKEILHKKYNATSIITLNLETLSSGTYFAKVLVEGKIQTFKVIKK